MMLVVVLAAGIVTLFAGAARVQRKLGLDHETSRKLVHITSALVATVAPVLVPDRTVLLIAAGILLVALPVGDAAGWFAGVTRRDRTVLGPVYFLAGYIVLLTRESAVTLAAAMLIAGFADAFACLVGRRWGRRRHVESQRTWLGSGAFAATALGIIFAMAPALGFSALVTLSLGLSVALATAALEAVVGSSLDNFAVPVLAALLLDFGGAWDDARALQSLVALGAIFAASVIAKRARLLRGPTALAVFAAATAAMVAIGWPVAAAPLAVLVVGTFALRAPWRSAREEE
jgi:dolichol kinase